MNRYFVSFLMTIFLYTFFISTFFYINQKNTAIAPYKKHNQRVKFKVSKQQKEIKKQLTRKKFKTKPIIKKSKQPKLKPKPSIKKEFLKKVLNIEPVAKIKSKKITTQIQKHKRSITIQEIRKRKFLKQQYLIQIKKAIAQNKIYPKRAIKRGVQGSMYISFIVSKDGRLLSYKIINGKNIFKKSAIIALRNSFPITPPSNVIKQNLELTVELKYILN